MAARNWDRTAAAVRRYDRVHRKYYSTDTHTGSFEGALEAMEDALKAVKEAFADDTADINDRDTAMLVSPDGNNGWLRKILVDAGHKDCGLTKEFRSSRGWGW